jgi:hypothetical protein
LQVTFLPLAEEAANNPDKYQTWIQEYDTIIPICHEGKNRSQVFVVADSISFECFQFPLSACTFTLRLIFLTSYLCRFYT